MVQKQSVVGCVDAIMNRSWCWLLAVTVVLLGIAPVSASGKTAPASFVVLPGTWIGIGNAGDRYVLLARGSQSVVRVVDTKWRTIRTQHLPAGCELSGTLDTPRDRLLLWCESGSAIMSLRDGRLVASGLHPIPSTNAPWEVIGSHWLYAPGHLYRNIATGEERHLTDDPVDFAWYRDLNDPNLGRFAFCTPFEQLLAYTGFRQWGGYVLLPNVTGPGPVRLGKCGAGKPVKNLSGKAALSDGTLSSGYTSWATPARKGSPCDRRIAVYDVKSKRTLRWASPVKRCVNLIQHTKYAVIIGWSVGSDPDDDTSDPAEVYRLSIAPRPRP